MFNLPDLLLISDSVAIGLIISAGCLAILIVAALLIGGENVTTH